MEKIKLITAIYLFLLFVSFCIGSSIYLTAGNFYKESTGVLMLLASAFVIYLFFFDRG